MLSFFGGGRRKSIDVQLSRVAKLPLRSQAICLFGAAEMSSQIWRQRERAKSLPPLAENLGQVFRRWLGGVASDIQLQNCGDELLKALESDTTLVDDPLASMAGHALHGVVLISLNQCEDVHDDILSNSILYAAAAATGTRREPFKQLAISGSDLTSEELNFIDEWWAACCQNVPQLA